MKPHLRLDTRGNLWRRAAIGSRWLIVGAVIEKRAILLPEAIVPIYDRAWESANGRYRESR